MNEIEKMYENAGVELTEGLEWVCKNPDHCIGQNLSVVPENCTGCEHFKREMKYPPLTAEKQLELIKWLTLNDFIDNLSITFRPFELMWVFQIYMVTEFASEKCASRMGADMTFEKGLASLINNLWQDLSEEEKQQVKGILE